MSLPVAATLDAALVNSFANDPAILPHCGFPAGTAHVDVSSRIGDPDIVFVTDGDAAMICFQQVRDGWEFHSMFRAAGRGRKAIDVARSMFDWLAAKVGTFTLIGVCPIENKPVRWFCRQLGMTSAGISNSEQFGQVETFRKDIQCL